jgi:hypothetical protein
MMAAAGAAVFMEAVAAVEMLMQEAVAPDT